MKTLLAAFLLGAFFHWVSFGNPLKRPEDTDNHAPRSPAPISRASAPATLPDGGDPRAEEDFPGTLPEGPPAVLKTPGRENRTPGTEAIAVPLAFLERIRITTVNPVTGEIDGKIREALQTTPGEEDRLREILDRTLEDLARIEADHVTVVRKEDGSGHLEIGPYREEALPLLDRFLSESVAALGDARGNVFAYGAYRNLGRFGNSRQRIEVQVSDDPSGTESYFIRQEQWTPEGEPLETFAPFVGKNLDSVTGNPRWGHLFED